MPVSTRLSSMTRSDRFKSVVDLYLQLVNLYSDGHVFYVEGKLIQEAPVLEERGNGDFSLFFGNKRNRVYLFDDNRSNEFNSSINELEWELIMDIEYANLKTLLSRMVILKTTNISVLNSLQ